MSMEPDSALVINGLTEQLQAKCLESARNWAVVQQLATQLRETLKALHDAETELEQVKQAASELAPASL